jgi:hypothetical protein
VSPVVPASIVAALLLLLLFVGSDRGLSTTRTTPGPTTYTEVRAPVPVSPALSLCIMPHVPGLSVSLCVCVC